MQSTGLSISAALSGHSLLQFYHHLWLWVPLLFLSSFWTVLPVFPDGVREEPPFHWCSLEWHQLLAVTIRHSSASSLRHPKTETWYIQVNGFSLRWLYYRFLRKCETVPWVRKGPPVALKQHKAMPGTRRSSGLAAPLPRCLQLQG